MHELAICEHIVAVALDCAEKAGASKIKKVHVRAGEMRHIIPELMNHYFNFLTKDTPAAGAQLEITITPAWAKCKECEKEYPVKNFVFECPQCGANSPELLSGMELILEDIEVFESDG